MTAADQSAATEVTKANLVKCLTRLLAQKDHAYIDSMKQKAKSGQVNVKGTQVTEDMILEALAIERKENGGLRWTPAEPSLASLANKAVSESEDAEPYNQRVRIIGNQKMPLLFKPDLAQVQRDQFMMPEQWCDTIARVVNKKDGRVYVRLRNQDGWVSSRSHKDLTKVVLEVEGSASLEPACTDVICRSRVARLLPAMTQEGHFKDQQKTLPPRRFCATMAVQKLATPDSTGAHGSKLNAKEEFLADGVFLRPSDGRAYLHLKDGSGWICERARSDFSKLAVEPCGSTEDFLEDDIEAVEPKVRRRDAGKKVIMLETEALGQETEEPGAKDNASPDVPMIFRSDTEIWPEELQPPKAIKKSMRQQLRRLYLSHGAKVKDCEEDLKEVTEKASAFGRSCPAQKELLQYAEALKKETQKGKKAWTDAVKLLLKETPVEKATESTPDVISVGSVSPVQVRGGRWFCAMMNREMEEGNVSGVSTRPCGPLRMNHQDAMEDLKRLQQAKDETLKRKSEAPEEEASAPKRGKTKVDGA